MQTTSEAEKILFAMAVKETPRFLKNVNFLNMVLNFRGMGVVSIITRWFMSVTLKRFGSWATFVFQKTFAGHKN